ncbi:methyltransferase domain-containing protein [uncultured Microbacterium sp.]|uniref:class I SAM-dependent methyltransferase n=1 Tax=uncultured Microbacterium sp. TaxID=191216 RepID=UPI0028D46CB2|nr:methyltransferase domain-containing protein [uncultured Microbacterium sp.]
MPVIDHTARVFSEAARVQQRLWSSDSEGWALFSEPHTRPLFEAVLAAAGLAPGDRLLDIACGTGLLLRIAADLGITVSGLDISPSMLAIAQRHVPAGDFHLSDLQKLPFADASFQAATAVNAFQFAVDPVAAIAEAARVLVPGGRLVCGMFAEPELSESTAVHLAMSALSPAARDRDHRPYALAGRGQLDDALSDSGLVLVGDGEVECVWAYQGIDDAIRGLIGSAGGVRAVEDAGRPAVVETLTAALGPFTDARTGRIAMRNQFRWVAAQKDANQ